MMRQKSTENLLDAYTRSNSVYAESGNWFLIRRWVAYGAAGIRPLMGRGLTTLEYGLLAKVGFDLFEGATLGLGHQGADEDEGENPDDGVSQERYARS